MEIDIEGAIEGCTKPYTKVYYALIRGRVYVNRTGRSCFQSKYGLVQSIRYHSRWRFAMKELAITQFGFFYPDKIGFHFLARYPKAEYVSEYREFEKAFMEKAFKEEIEIKELNLPN